MYAIVKTGGKQYKVKAGDIIYVESLGAPAGEKITLDQVLMVGGDADSVHVGSPLLSNASVSATVVEQGRDHKIRVFKYKKRKHYRRTRGHRQSYTAIKVDSIQL